MDHACLTDRSSGGCSDVRLTDVRRAEAFATTARLPSAWRNVRPVSKKPWTCYCRPRRLRPLVVPNASELCERAPGGAGSPQQQSPAPGLSGRRPPHLWSSPQPPPVPPAPPPPICVDREQGVATSGASSPAQTTGPCVHALVPPLRSGSRRGCPVRRTSPVCGGLSNMGRRAGGAPLNVLRAGAVRHRVRERLLHLQLHLTLGLRLPGCTWSRGAVRRPVRRPGPGSLALWRPSVARLLPSRNPPFRIRRGGRRRPTGSVAPSAAADGRPYNARYGSFVSR